MSHSVVEVTETDWEGSGKSALCNSLPNWWKIHAQKYAVMYLQHGLLIISVSKTWLLEGVRTMVDCLGCIMNWSI